jgi:hypothetical protein
VGVQHHAPSASPPVNRPSTRCTESLVSSRSGEKNLAPTGIRSPDRPAGIKSLYRLRFPVHNNNNNNNNNNNTTTLSSGKRIKSEMLSAAQAVLMGTVSEPELNQKGSSFIQYVGMRLTTKKTKLHISEYSGHLRRRIARTGRTHITPFI